jgi:Domain of unknown function (DUF4173)
MYLYTQQFGLTELRLYTTIFILWISVVFVWLVLTVLTGRGDRFAFGVLVTGFAAILMINALNPDALIARINLYRMEAGKEFDAFYLTHLSADAAPVLVESLPRMSEPDRRLVKEHLHSRWSEEGDWRTWNLGRSRAQQLVEARIDVSGEPAASANASAQTGAQG